MENYNNKSNEVTAEEAASNPWKKSTDDLTKDNAGNVVPKTYIQDSEEAHDLALVANKSRSESMDRMRKAFSDEPSYNKDKVYTDKEKGINWVIGTAESVLDVMKDATGDNGKSISTNSVMRSRLAKLAENKTISANEYDNIRVLWDEIRNYTNGSVEGYNNYDSNARDSTYFDRRTGAKRDSYRDELIITPDDVVEYAKAKIELIKNKRQDAIRRAGVSAISEAEHKYDYDKNKEQNERKIKLAKDALNELAKDGRII